MFEFQMCFLGSYINSKFILTKGQTFVEDKITIFIRHEASMYQRFLFNPGINKGPIGVITSSKEHHTHSYSQIMNVK